RALRGGGEQLADLFGLVGLRPFERLLHVLPAGRRQRPPALVVDQLRADPPIGPEDRQTRPLRRPRDLAAHTTTAPRTCFTWSQRGHEYPPRESTRGKCEARFAIFMPVSRPSSARTRPCSGCPCPCTARAAGPCESRRRPDRPAACRCP